MIKEIKQLKSALKYWAQEENLEKCLVISKMLNELFNKSNKRLRKNWNSIQ